MTTYSNNRLIATTARRTLRIETVEFETRQILTTRAHQRGREAGGDAGGVDVGGGERGGEQLRRRVLARLDSRCNLRNSQTLPPAHTLFASVWQAF